MMQSVPKKDEKFVPSYLEIHTNKVDEYITKRGSSLLDAEIGTESWLVEGAEGALLKRFREGLQARVDAGHNQDSIAEDLVVVRRTAVTNILNEKSGLSTKSLSAIKVAYNIPFPSHKEMVAAGTAKVIVELCKILGGEEGIFDVELFWCLHRLFNCSEWPEAMRAWSKTGQSADYEKLEILAGSLLAEVRGIMGRPLSTENADDLIRLAKEKGEIFLIAVHLVYRKLTRDNRTN